MIVLLIRTVFVFALLNFGLRLTGKRQIGELEISELITTLLVSELAATPIVDPDVPLISAALPILFISALEILLAFASSKNRKLKKLIDGSPGVLIRDGVIDQRALADLRMSCQELFSQLRRSGIGDPRDVRYALLEGDGQLSVFGVSNPGGIILHTMFADGEPCLDNLRLCGKDESWLDGRLANAGIDRKKVFLFAANGSGDELLVPADVNIKKKGKKK